MHVTEIAAKALRELAPDTTHQQMLSELDKLRKENASLKATSKTPAHANPLPNPSGSKAEGRRGVPVPPKRVAKAKPSNKRQQSIKETMNKPVEVEIPEPADEDDQAGDDEDTQVYGEGQEEDLADESDAAGAGALEDVEGYEIQHFQVQGHPMYLESCVLEKANQQSVNTWIKENLGKNLQKVVEEKTGELFKTLEKAPPGQRIPLDRLAVQWGLSVSLAGRLNDKALAKLICACTTMEEDMDG